MASRAISPQEAYEWDQDRKADFRRVAPNLKEHWVDQAFKYDLSVDFVAALNELDEISIQRQFQFVSAFSSLVAVTTSTAYQQARGLSFKKAKAAYDPNKKKIFFDTISSGGSSHDAFTEYCNSLGFKSLRKTHIKRIQIMQPCFGDMDLLDAAAMAMDINIFPKTLEDLNALQRFNEALVRIFYNNERSLLNDQSPEFSQIFDSLRVSILSRFKSKDYQYFNIQSDADISGFIEMMRWLKTEVGSALPKDKNMEILFHVLTPVELFELGTSIEKAWAKISREIRQFDEQKYDQSLVVQEWISKYPEASSDQDVHIPVGLKIVPLTTRRNLIEDHEMMGGTCVDTYAQYAIVGTSFIFSLRNAQNRSLSTFELDSQGYLIQHKGFRNQPPGEEEKQAVFVYLRAIASGKIPLNPAYEKWAKKAESLSFLQIRGYEMGDVDRSTLLISIVSNVPGIPKRAKEALNKIVQENIRFNGIRLETKPY